MRTKKKLILLSGFVSLAILFILLSGVLTDKPASTVVSQTSQSKPLLQPETTPETLTPTALPTATVPAPTATATAVPTATPAPSATPTVVPTPTPVPAPTVTPIIDSAAPKIAFQDRFTFRKTDTVRYLKPGIIQVQRQELGPIRLNVLLFDLTAPELNLKVALQDDWLSGVARTSAFGKANNAIAAVNGDLFSASGLPQGMTMTDGRLALAPKHRATFAYSKENGPFIGYFTQGFTWSSSVVAANGERHSLEILNSICKENWLCIYNDLYRQLPAGSNDVRVILNSDNEVTAIKQETLVSIPTGSQVLLGKGLAGKWLLENTKIGEKFELNMVTDPDYHSFDQIVSGGPVFLRRGQFVQDCLCYLDDCSQSTQKEVTCEEFTTEWKFLHYLTVRMPRNAIGYNADKSVLIVAVVDGYQPGYSIGMTQKELAGLMVEFGAESAMELDGGGSATMYVQGKLASHPSDGNGTVERMVPDALVFQWNGSSTDSNLSDPTSSPDPSGNGSYGSSYATPTRSSTTPRTSKITTPTPTVKSGSNKK